MTWTWSWIPSGGPASTASFGDNLVFDLIRLATILTGFAMAWGILRILVEQRRRPEDLPASQTARFLALLLADLSLSGTELWVMGTPATPRLLVNVLVVAFGTYGVWGIRKEQRRQPIVR